MENENKREQEKITLEETENTEKENITEDAEASIEELSGNEGGETVSPNELLFGNVKKDEAKVKKEKNGKSLKKRIILISSISVVLVLAITLGVLALTGVLKNFYESYIMSPEDQLRAVLKREAGKAIDDYKEGQTEAEPMGKIELKGMADARVDSEFLDTLNGIDMLDFDFTSLEVLNELDLYYSLLLDEGDATVTLNLDEAGESLGAIAAYDSEQNYAYLAIPLLTDALLGDEVNVDLSSLAAEVHQLTDDEADELKELNEKLIDDVFENVDSVVRDREVLEAEESLKCDRLSFTVDREQAVDILISLAELIEEEHSELIKAIMSESGYDRLMHLLKEPDDALPKAFSLNLIFWVHDSEVVGFDFEEKESELGYYRMYPTNVIEVDTNIMGIPVKIGGEYKDGNGEFTIRSFMGFKAGKIVVEDLNWADGVLNGTVTVTFSDEIVKLATTAAGESFISDIFGDSSFLEELGEYALTINFESDEITGKAEITLVKSDKELVYLSFDSNTDVTLEPFDTEGYEVYSLSEFSEWRETIKLSGELISVLLDAPECISDNLGGIIDYIPEDVLDFALDGKLDGVIDGLFGGYLDDVLDPWLDDIQEMLPDGGEDS